LEAYTEALGASPTPAEEAEAYLRSARVHRSMANWEQCTAASQRAVEIADRVGADDIAAEAMNVEMGALQNRGRFEEADVIGRVAIARAQSPRVRGITLQNLGRGAAERGDFETSDRYFDASIEAFRDANYEFGLLVALTNTARAAFDRGDPRRSLEIGREGVMLARRLNALDVLGTIFQNQAAAFVAVGNLDAAEALLTESLGHFTSARIPLRQAECLEIMGEIGELRSDLATARRCYERAVDLATGSDRSLVERLTNRLDKLGS
jgi:tetratricopeptide (TPR) repeat protein